MVARVLPALHSSYKFLCFRETTQQAEFSSSLNLMQFNASQFCKSAETQLSHFFTTAFNITINKIFVIFCSDGYSLLTFLLSFMLHRCVRLLSKYFLLKNRRNSQLVKKDKRNDTRVVRACLFFRFVEMFD